MFKHPINIDDTLTSSLRHNKSTGKNEGMENVMFRKRSSSLGRSKNSDLQKGIIDTYTSLETSAGPERKREK